MLRRMLTMEHDRIDFDELEGITASWQGRRRRRRRERGREGERKRVSEAGWNGTVIDCYTTMEQ